MSASFKSTGFGDFDRALARLVKGVPEATLRAALHEGGQMIVEEAQRIVPVDTGELRDSIACVDERDARVYGKLNGGGISLYIGPVGSTEDGDVYYARFVEFGSARHGPQPFMRPAIAAKRPAAEQLVAARLAMAVTDLARDA